MKTPPVKKYKLFSKAASDGGPAPCAFFASAKGCRSGSNCKFSHSEVSAPAATPSRPRSSSVISSESSSVVSSESEDEGSMFSPPVANKKLQQAKPEKVAQPTPDAGDKKSKKRKKQKDPEPTQLNKIAPPAPTSTLSPNVKPGSYASLAFSAESGPPPTPPTNKTSKRQKKTPVPAAPVVSFQKSPKPPKDSRTQRSTGASPLPSFRNLDLPIACFSIPDPKAKDDGNVSPPSSPQHEDPPEEVLESPPPKHLQYPLPSSTPEGLKWSSATHNTRLHSRYETSFNFDKYKQMDEDGKRGSANDWIIAKPYGSWCKGNPHAIAIDCEMCETKDPVTGATDPKALCRVSIVSAINPDEVLLDTLVKPAWPVVDYRSRINGIKKEHLDNVQFTLRHAQAFMLALCSNETVIIGHAIHNDLVALKMEHHTNVDSAFLYTVKDEERATPSLKDLAMSVMKKEMPDTHDSVNDARTSLLCMEYYIQNGGVVDPIVRSFPTRGEQRRKRLSSGGSGDMTKQLLVHRIPKVCEAKHLTAMLISHASIKPKSVSEIEFSGSSDTGKAYLTFASAAHTELAFESLAGEAKPDKGGKLQKRVYLREGDYVQVRKMVS